MPNTAERTETLSDFLLARIAEDEKVARAAQDDEGETWEEFGLRYVLSMAAQVRTVETETTVCHATSVEDAAHIARHDPARVLAECEAKRRIVEIHSGDGQCAARQEEWYGPTPWPCATLRALALPYADHPDYREEWRLG